MGRANDNQMLDPWAQGATSGPAVSPWGAPLAGGSTGPTAQYASPSPLAAAASGYGGAFGGADGTRADPRVRTHAPGRSDSTSWGITERLLVLSVRRRAAEALRRGDSVPADRADGGAKKITGGRGAARPREGPRGPRRAHVRLSDVAGVSDAEPGGCAAGCGERRRVRARERL